MPSCGCLVALLPVYAAADSLVGTRGFRRPQLRLVSASAGSSTRHGAAGGRRFAKKTVAAAAAVAGRARCSALQALVGRAAGPGQPQTGGAWSMYTSPTRLPCLFVAETPQAAAVSC